MKISSVVSEDGHWYPVQKRTGAMIAELLRLQDQIESSRLGRVEIDYNPKTVLAAIRDVGEPRPVD